MHNNHNQLYNNNKNLEKFDNLLITLENNLGDAWKNTLIVTQQVILHKRISSIISVHQY